MPSNHLCKGGDAGKQQKAFDWRSILDIAKRKGRMLDYFFIMLSLICFLGVAWIYGFDAKCEYEILGLSRRKNESGNSK